MEAARVLPMSVAGYLAFEESSAVKHEFVGGEIHAMSGASLAHNKIALNIATALRAALRGGPCQVFMADVKVRLEAARDEFFYYPDVVVTCAATDLSDDPDRLAVHCCRMLGTPCSANQRLSNAR